MFLYKLINGLNKGRQWSSNTIMIVNCHIINYANINDIQKHFSIKIMELNTLIDVFSMLLRSLNLADGLHATHTDLKETSVSDLFQCQIK